MNLIGIEDRSKVLSVEVDFSRFAWGDQVAQSAVEAFCQRLGGAITVDRYWILVHKKFSFFYRKRHAHLQCLVFLGYDSR